MLGVQWQGPCCGIFCFGDGCRGSGVAWVALEGAQHTHTVAVSALRVDGVKHRDLAQDLQVEDTTPDALPLQV